MGRRLLLLLLWYRWSLAGAVTIEALKKHNHGEIDEDEFAWGKLNGRCCFLLKEVCPSEDSPRDQCTKTSPSSCKECDVWSEPDNYCHLSKDNCQSCGMQLYCPRPPPLLDGNKICTGNSRVGQGCVDEQDTGLCAGRDFSDCEDACRAVPSCQLFVFYPEERKGSCILCRDLFSFERTPDAATRAYAVTPAASPPAPASSQPQLFSVVLDSPPPLSPRISPPPPPTQLGHHRGSGGREHTDCTFDNEVEYTVDQEEGYVISTAPTKEECCALCGHTGGCTDFVFEPSSGTCVLLPHIADESQIEAFPNPTVISGSIRISITPTVIPSTACSFVESSGYALGMIGTGKAIPGGNLLTKEDCCQSCGAVATCAKFTWQDESQLCTHFEAYAEMVKVPNQISGTVNSKLMGAGMSTLTALNGSMGDSSQLELPPSMPELASILSLVPPPPPPPAKSDSSITQMIIERVSFGVVVIMTLTFSMCLYLFFSPQILKALYQLTGGKMGRLGPAHIRVPAVEPAGDLMETSSQLASRREECELNPGYAKLLVETKSMVQSRCVDIRACSSISELRGLIFREFATLLKGVRPSKSALFCLTSLNDHDEDSIEMLETQSVWCLVTEKSNASKVLQCKSFKLISEMSEEDLRTASIAFEQGRSGTSHSKSSRSAASELPRRSERHESRLSQNVESSRFNKSARGRNQRRNLTSSRSMTAIEDSDSPQETLYLEERVHVRALSDRDDDGFTGSPQTGRSNRVVSTSVWDDDDDGNTQRNRSVMDDLL